jgi:hypothetical protein
LITLIIPTDGCAKGSHELRGVRAMTKLLTESDLGVRLYDYIQVDKINQLYNQTVERVEKSLSKKWDKGRVRSVKGEGGFGELLTLLGLKLSIGGTLESKSADSEETIYELSSEQKLRIVWRHLCLEGLASDLNVCLREGVDCAPFVLVRFKGVNGRFAFVDSSSKPHDPHTLIRVHCEVEGYSAEFFCSRGYFQGSALLYDIQEGLVRDIAGIAAVKAVDHQQKEIVLNPICF